jgi:hypothetical protein
MPGSITLPSSYSFCFWFQSLVVASGETLFYIGRHNSGADVLKVYRNGTSNDLCVATGSPRTLNFNVGPYLNVNVWGHLCVTFTSTIFTIYMNGAQVATGSYGGQSVVARPFNTIFGGYETTADLVFRGRMDEVRLYNRVLTAVEVQAVHAFRGDSYTSVFPIQCPTGFSTNGTGASTCVQCATGTFILPGFSSCRQCQAGTYSSLTGLSTCTACPPGRFTNFLGATHLAVCVSCQASTYNRLPGSTGCTACPANSINNGGTTWCTVAAGFYNLASSMIAYYPFNPGSAFLEDKTGQTGSITGPLINVGGVTSLSGVRDGVANIAQVDISNPNALMQYLAFPQITLSSTFTACMWIHPLVSNPSTVFFSMENTETISDGIRIRNSVSASLPTCLIGEPMVNGTTASSTVVGGCRGFSPNVWSHVCVSVSGTEYTGYLNGVFYASATLQSAMPSLTYASGNAWIGRGRRSAPLYSGYVDEVRIFDRSMSAYDVEWLYQFNADTDMPVVPVGCPAGTFNANSGAPTSGFCNPCARGLFQSGVGITRCMACVAGTFTSATRGTVCTACAAGTFSTALRVSACVGCAVGKFGSGVGMVNSGVCVSCGAGTFSSATGGSVCTACAAGTFSTAVEAAGCAGCAAGKFSSGVGMVDAGVCVSCGAGTFSSASGAGACTGCGAGSFSSGVGMADAAACATCAAGEYSNRTDASACDACPANTASPAAATAITQCAANAGFYARYTRTIRATVTVPEAQYDAAAFLAQLQVAAGPGATVTIG